MRIIRYAFGTNMANELVIKALENAYNSQKSKDDVIFHTNLESQYTSKDMKQLCTKSFSKICICF